MFQIISLYNIVKSKSQVNYPTLKEFLAKSWHAQSFQILVEF